MEIVENAANPAETEGVIDLDAHDKPEASEAPSDIDALIKEATGDAGANPVEWTEVEIDGRKFKVESVDGVPIDPDFKFGVMRDADYRKKTMSVAEERRAFEEERNAHQARVNLEGDAQYRARELSSLEAKVRQAAGISVDALRAQGWTDQDIQAAADELRNLTEQRDGLKRQVQQDVRQLQETSQAAFEKQRGDAIRKAQLENKALTDDRITYLEKFAVDNGIDPAEARSITDPVAYNLLHYADIGMKLAARQKAADTLGKAASGAPAQTLGGMKSGNKDPAGMSPAEMSKFLGY